MLTEGTVPFIVVRASLHHIVINSNNVYSYNWHQRFGDVSNIGASIRYLNTSQHCYSANIVSDIAIFVLKRDVKLQLTN